MTGLLLFIALAHGDVDRRALVTGTFRTLPYLIEVLDERAAKLPDNELRVFRKVREQVRARNIALTFSTQEDLFDLGEAPRLMITPVNAPGQIDVNEKLLNADATALDVPNVAKLLFHEYAQKIGVDDMGFRDRVAQWFENEVRAFHRAYQLGGRDLEILSVPATFIKRELESMPADEAQPTNLVLLHEKTAVRDLTPSVLAGVGKSSGLLRTLWEELNRLGYELTRAAIQSMRDAIEAQLRGVNASLAARGLPPMDFTDVTSQFDLGVNEVRVLELQDVEPIANGAQARIKGTWHTYKVENRFKFNVNGPLPTSDRFAVPLTLRAELLGAPKFDATIRPNLDASQSARVISVQRDGLSGRVAKLVVAHRPGSTQVYLSIDSSLGQRLLRASHTDGERSTFTFENMDLGGVGPLTAESLRLSGDMYDVSVYLNRTVELTAENEPPAVPPDHNQIVRGGVYVLQNHEDTIWENFKSGQPIAMAPGLDTHGDPSLDADGIRAQVQLKRGARVREMRLQLKRMAPVVKRVPGAVTHVVQWGKQRLEMGGAHADVTEAKYYFETLVADGASLIALDDREVLGGFNAPFLPGGAIDAGKLHFPAIVTPLALEVVLDDGQVLTRVFGEARTPEECALELELREWNVRGRVDVWSTKTR